MHNILTCSFPCGPAADPKSFVQLILAQYNASPFYTFSDAHFDQLPQSASYRDSVTCSEGMLEFISCSMPEANLIGARLEKLSEAENTMWFADFILEQPHTSGSPRIHICMGRSILDPDKPADFTICPIVPRAVAALHDAGMILRSPDHATNANDPDQPLPYILVGPGCSRNLIKQLKRKIGLLAHVIYPAEPGEHLINEHDICLFYPKTMTKKHYLYNQNSGPLSTDIAQDAFSLISQAEDPKSISWNRIDAACPASAAKEDQRPQNIGSHCFMNQEMAARLRTARRELGLSQHALAQRVHVSNLVISRLETLRVSRVTTSLLQDLERVLNLPENSIISLQNTHTVQTQQTESSAVPSCTAEPESQPQLAPEAPAAHRPPRFCRLCGSKLYEDSRFCSNCGGKVLP